MYYVQTHFLLNHNKEETGESVGIKQDALVKDVRSDVPKSYCCITTKSDLVSQCFSVTDFWIWQQFYEESEVFCWEIFTETNESAALNFPVTLATLLSFQTSAVGIPEG